MQYSAWSLEQYKTLKSVKFNENNEIFKYNNQLNLLDGGTNTTEVVTSLVVAGKVKCRSTDRKKKKDSRG